MEQKREKKVKHSTLGIINISFNPRATRYILKVRDGEIYATLPKLGTEEVLWKFIDENKSTLLKQLTEHPKNRLNEETKLHTHTFKLRIYKSDRTNFYCSLKEEQLHIACPEKTDFENEKIQEVLRNFIIRALRHEAKRILPNNLLELALKHGFRVNNIVIKGNTSNWGSCSSHKNINLSYQIMTLPTHLIEYILLHELCHTVEMNHSPRFWELLDQVCGGNNAHYREEMKSQKMFDL